MACTSNSFALVIAFVQLCLCVEGTDHKLSEIVKRKEIVLTDINSSIKTLDTFSKEKYLNLNHREDERKRRELSTRFHKKSKQSNSFFMEASPCSTTNQHKEVLVDCTNKGIGAVNSSWFEANATGLLLDYNCISVLTNGSFSKLTRLRTLSISYNKLNKVYDGAFLGLESLEVLNLEHNNLIPKRSFSLNIFSSLLNLKSLLLVQEQSLLNSTFPDLRRLTNLTTLSLDTVDEVVSFGEDFKGLKLLSSLTLSGSAKVIGNQSFANVPRLNELRLIKLPMLSEIDMQAMAHLKYLESFKVNASPIGIRRTMSSLESLQKSKMTEIFLTHLMLRNKNQSPSLLSQDGVLNRDKTKYLLEVCVGRFTLSNSNIYVVSHDAFVSETWHFCLKFIDLSDNPIKGTVVGMARLLTMRNLEVIFLRGCLRPRTKTNIISDATIPTRSESDLNIINNGTFQTNRNETDMNRFKSIRLAADSVTGIMVHLSSSLRVIDVGSCITRSGLSQSMTFVGAWNLAYLDMSDNGFKKLTGNFHGFTGLKTVILSGNELENLSSTFFDSFPRLEDLNLAETKLNPEFFSVSSQRLFQKLSNLKKLSLEGNSLSLLSPNTFSNNSDITHLILSGNRFNRVPFDLKNTPKLQVLDIQNNAIVTIDQETRDNLDLLANNLGGFQLTLGGNVMLCVCENVRFLYWLVHTSVALDRDGNFSCIYNDGVLTYTAAFTDPEVVWRQCSGQFYFSVSIFLFSVLIIGFLSTFIITRNKTLILSTLLQIFTKFKVLKSEDYKTGVLIGYADDDYVFACTDLRRYIEDTLGLTTYLKDRDLLPTFDMAQGIMEAINSSWRVLLVVNTTLLNDDHWSLFTMKSAVYSLTPANPDGVVVLVDELLLSKLPGDLLSSVLEDNVITVSRWEMTYRLKEMLRTRLRKT